MARLTDREQSAQRLIARVIRANSWLTRDGLAVWRHEVFDERGVGAAKVAEDLHVLRVPFSSRAAWKPGLSGSVRRRRGTEIRVEWADLPALCKHLPFLATAVQNVPADEPGFRDLVVVCVYGTRAEVRAMNYAADWPCWTSAAAARMGLMCTWCGCDLRDLEGDGLPYRLLSEAGQSMYCPPCADRAALWPATSPIYAKSVSTAVRSA